MVHRQCTMIHCQYTMVHFLMGLSYKFAVCTWLIYFSGSSDEDCGHLITTSLTLLHYVKFEQLITMCVVPKKLQDFLIMRMLQNY